MVEKSERPRPRPVTMKQVAAAAGVDVSVISRVVNGDPRLSISQATRDRVLAKIRELDYRPNLAARALRTSRGGLIAFVVPNFTSAVNAPVISGATARAAECGYSLVLAEDVDAIASQVRDLQARGVAGILVAGATLSRDAVARLAEFSLPTVMVNNEAVAGLSTVEVDYDSAARLAVDHLIDLGHRRVAVLRGPAEMGAPNSRSDMFANLLRAQGGTPAEFALDRLTSDGAAEVASALAADEAITAVFSPTLLPAMGVVARMQELGIAVPQRFSVISLHDAAITRLAWPHLTAVALPMEEMGAAAVDQVVRMIGGGEVRRSVVTTPPVLMRRASTATAKLL